MMVMMFYCVELSCYCAADAACVAGSSFVSAILVVYIRYGRSHQKLAAQSNDKISLQFSFEIAAKTFTRPGSVTQNPANMSCGMLKVETRIQLVIPALVSQSCDQSQWLVMELFYVMRHGVWLCPSKHQKLLILHCV